MTTTPRTALKTVLGATALSLGLLAGSVGLGTVLPVEAASQPDLNVTLSASSTTLVPGSAFTVTAMLRNTGTAAAADVAARFTLPVAPTLDSVEPDGGFSCQTAGGGGTSLVVTCVRSGNFVAGASATTRLRLTAPPAVNGTTGNLFGITAAVDPQGQIAESNEQNNTATVTVQVAPRPDLDVDITAAPTTVTAGERLTYQLRVRNRGRVAAANISVRADLPEGVEYVEAAGTHGLACTHAGVTVRCSGGSLAASLAPAPDVRPRPPVAGRTDLGAVAAQGLNSAETRITIVGRVPASAHDGRHLLFGATVDPERGLTETDEYNNTVSALTTVRGLPDVRLTAGAAGHDFGGHFYFTLNVGVHNHGGSMTGAATLRVQVPSGAFKQDEMRIDAACRWFPLSNAIECAVPALPAGEAMMFAFFSGQLVDLTVGFTDHVFETAMQLQVPEAERNQQDNQLTYTVVVPGRNT